MAQVPHCTRRTGTLTQRRNRYQRRGERAASLAMPEKRVAERRRNFASTNAFYGLCTSAHDLPVKGAVSAAMKANDAMTSQAGAGKADEKRPNNNLLRRLREADYALIAPFCERSENAAGDQLYRPGDNVETVHFPCGPSLVSFLVSNEDGRDVETILIGREGAVGGIVSAGNLPAYCRITVKYGGPFMRLRATHLEAAKTKSLTLRHLFARYADCVLAQVFQSTACNAIHSIEQRAAKWILSALERTGDHAVLLTHEQLATMLGVGRSYTSRIVQTFKLDGTLDTRRGSLVIKNIEALKARACLCNEAVKSHFEAVLRGVYPDDRSP